MAIPERDLVLETFLHQCREKQDWETPPPPGLFDNLTADDLTITVRRGDGSFEIGIRGPGFSAEGVGMFDDPTPGVRYYKHDFGNPQSNGWSLVTGVPITSDVELNAITEPGIYIASIEAYTFEPARDVIVAVYDKADNTDQEAIELLIAQKFDYQLPEPSELYDNNGVKVIKWDEYHPDMYSMYGEVYCKDIDVLVDGFITAPEV